MEPKEMIELLKIGGIRVITQYHHIYNISHTCNNTVIYFWENGYYNSYSNVEGGKDYEQLLERLSFIIRIEKLIDSEYYPIWTIEDGLITQNEKSVRLHGRYYTISFLEDLIDKINEFNSSFAVQKVLKIKEKEEKEE